MKKYQGTKYFYIWYIEYALKHVHYGRMGKKDNSTLKPLN